MKNSGYLGSKLAFFKTNVIYNILILWEYLIWYEVIDHLYVFE